MLGAGATAAALAATSLPAAPAASDAELIRLRQELERELARLPELAATAHDLYPDRDGGPLSAEESALWTARAEECGHIAAYKAWGGCDDRIRARLSSRSNQSPTTTLGGLVAKANAVLFSAS